MTCAVGRILVTLRNDPGWAPLFPLARGILVEVAARLALRHLARELGDPAVVGVPDRSPPSAMDRPRLDGATGTVEVGGAMTILITN